MPTSSAAHRSQASGASARRVDKNRSSAPSTTRTRSAKARTKDASADSATVLSTADIIEKATLPLTALTTRDALTVWKAVGLYLSDQLIARHRVVAIDRFGVFGNNDAGEAVFLHTSVFLQSNRVKESISKQGLRGQPALAANAEPMSKMNAAEIGQEYLQNCGRELVESVIANVVAFVGKMAKQGRAMRLSLLPLGEWRCTGDKAEFSFLLEFQQQMIKSNATQRKSNDTSERSAKTSEQPVVTTAETKKEEVREVEESLTPQKLRAHTSQQQERGSRSEHSSTRTATEKDSSRPRRVAWGSNAKAPPTASRHKESDETVKPKDVVARVKATLIERCGDRGLNALQRVLSLMDTSGDGVLTTQELKFGLRDLGIELSASELRQVVAFFDRNGDGIVSLDELLDRLRGGSNGKGLVETRRALILKAFDCIDQKRRGVVSLDDLRDNYDVSLLPKVRAGKKTKVQAMAEFLREWETSAEHNNGITRAAFVEHYHNVSACIPDDSDFELLMRQTWHVVPSESEPESDSEDESPEAVVRKSPPMNQAALGRTASTRAAAKESDSSATVTQWRYLQSKLLPPNANSIHMQPTLDDMSRRLGANRVWGDSNDSMNTRAFANALSIIDRQLNAKDAQQLARLVADVCGSGSGDSIALGALYQFLKSGSFTHSQSTGLSSSSSPQPAIASTIIDRIRARLLQRLQADTSSATDVGLNALSRTLRLLDSNNDKRLSKDELKLGLRKLGVDINFHELDHLFTCLDADRSGCIDTDEFLVAMRGENAMNAARLKLVHMAFDRLDRDRDGTVTMDELSKAYDTSKHPEVVAGRMTKGEALRHFAQQWDTDQRDGAITRHEFETYYRNVSACIDRDEYFELMMRNAWHISGGTGQSANTSNRRVLVTKADGSQNVEEVKDDLGIRASDTDKIRQNLAQQGVAAADIKMYSSIEDKPRKRTPARAPPLSRATSKPTAQAETLRVPEPKSSRPDSREKQPAVSDLFASSGGRHSEEADAKAKQQRIRDRQRRERAALMIQTHFRGFKCRKFVDCVRRQMVAEQMRKKNEERDQESRRRGVTRAAIKSYYGF